MSIDVGREAVPFASDDRDRRADQARIVGEQRPRWLCPATARLAS
jgi:hypothetical protein